MLIFVFIDFIQLRFKLVFIGFLELRVGGRGRKKLTANLKAK